MDLFQYVIVAERFNLNMAQIDDLVAEGSLHLNNESFLMLYKHPSLAFVVEHRSYKGESLAFLSVDGPYAR